MVAYFIGIDIGTQGARVILIDSAGDIISSAEHIFPLTEKSRQEQSPATWWESCCQSLSRLLTHARHIDFNHIKAIAVTSTSGTVIPLDRDHKPLHNAIMYSDKRSAAQAEQCTLVALKYHNGGYTAFNFSSGLAKMVWFVETYPEKAKKIRKWVHAADYLTGMLSNSWGITDYTNALKSGYDVSRFQWPEYICTHLPVKEEWFPKVVPSGTVIGNLAPDVAAMFGLPETVEVTAGITDGCASQIASGAVNPGDWNTTIGTTMVIKGVTENEIRDPLGRLYSHRHPEGYWMPGGASNTGADWITNEFTDDLEKLNRQAQALIPTGYISYPLKQNGERFPFISFVAKGFEPKGLTQGERFTANMEGVAYLERYAYELAEHLSQEKVAGVFSAGGGSNSDVWLNIRSNVLNKPIYKMKHHSGAVGAAILAAAKFYGSVVKAAKALTVIDREVYPEGSLVAKYEANYQKFIEVMKQKGYIKKDFNA